MFCFRNNLFHSFEKFNYFRQRSLYQKAIGLLSILRPHFCQKHLLSSSNSRFGHVSCQTTYIFLIPPILTSENGIAGHLWASTMMRDNEVSFSKLLNIFSGFIPQVGGFLSVIDIHIDTLRTMFVCALYC